MKVGQQIFRRGAWSSISHQINNADLVLMFGSSNLIGDKDVIKDLKDNHPSALILRGSTSGNIIGAELIEEGLTFTAIEFDKSSIRGVEVAMSEDSFRDGKSLIGKLEKDNLKHVFILSDGLNVNATELIKGINTVLPDNVNVTGGLAGDGVHFKVTKVGLDDNLDTNNIVAIGLYGKDLKISYAAEGGWERFGIERIVTKSKGNVIYELDNQEVIRTIQSINEEERSISFFGDIPEGAIVYLTTGNFSSLTKGAKKAVVESKNMLGVQPELAIMISCVGRKVVMTEWTEDELGTVLNEIGTAIPTTGFYSYGELSPCHKNTKTCLFHNQTMALTLLSEK